MTVHLRVLVAVAALTAATWLGGAMAFGQADEHGAASPEAQIAQLQTLALTVPAEAPSHLDLAIWTALQPDDNPLTPERIELGRKLYFEKALSRDGTVSCATCHDVTRSFTDLRAVSEGVDAQQGKRNAPTTANAALLQSQFWDGRAATLEEQAKQPILNPVEMAMPDGAAAVQALQAIPAYEALFQAAYGRGVNYDDVGRAIAAFERTLIFLDAPFDRYMAGDTTALSPAAKAGHELFLNKARCVTCHPINSSNPIGTDHRFHNIGVSARDKNFEALAKRALDAMAVDPSASKLDELAIGTDLSELGRFMVTHDAVDTGAFRTPQLRNVGITAPYMHDGSMETLWDVTDHYNKGGEDNAFLDGGVEALELSEDEIDQLVAFLFSLTDERFSAANQTAFDHQHALASTQRPLRDNDRAQRRVTGFERRVMGQPGGDQ